MNNGEYSGPLISRNSPRWRMQEYTPPMSTASTTGHPLLFVEPYIPPTVTAVMVTATAGSSVSNTIATSAASCHNLVFPLKDRRFFIEMPGGAVVRFFLAHDADLLNATSTNLLNASEIAVYLNQAGLGSAIVYSRGATTQFTVGANSSLPFLNGFIAGGITFNDTFSLVNPRLRRAGATAGSRINPGNLKFASRGTNGINIVTPGAAPTDTANAFAHPYVRLEYLV